MALFLVLIYLCLMDHSQPLFCKGPEIHYFSLRQDQDSSEVYSGIHQLGNNFLFEIYFPESDIVRFLLAPLKAWEKNNKR